MSSELSPQLGYQSLSARCTDAGDTRLLSSHYEIVETAAAAGDDVTLTNQCNILQDFLANKYIRGGKVHKAQFDEKQKFKRGMNLAKWFEARFVEISQDRGGEEMRYFLSERLALHPHLQLPPPKSIMDIAKARVSPKDTDAFMLKSLLHAAARRMHG